MRAEDFRIAVRQGAIWTDHFEAGTRRLLSLANAWSRRFDGEPVVIPPSPALPPEVPRLVIPSSDGQWRIQVAPRRCDVFWEYHEGHPQASAEEFTREVADAFGAFFGQVVGPDELRVTRMAYTTQRWAEADQPGRELARYFCRSDLQEAGGPLNRPEEFQLHAHKRYAPEGMPRVNSWVRWITGKHPTMGHDGILLMQDLNTMAEEEDRARYSEESVRSFIELAAREVDGILRAYLPNQTTARSDQR